MILATRRFPDPTAYSSTARRLHWLMAVLVIFQVAAGLMMVQEHPESNVWARIAEALSLYDAHKVMGLVLLALALARLAYRIGRGAPADEPTLDTWQREASHMVHSWVYLLLILVPLLGWLGISLYPAVVVFNALTLPSLAPPDQPKSAIVLTAHAYAAFLLIGLVAIHICAALFHHFVRRDDVLRRMLPGLRRRGA